MFRVINIRLLFKFVAVFTAFVSILTYEMAREYWHADLPVVKVFSIAPWVAAGLFLVLTTDITARLMWRLVRKFKKDIFPDLNGTWAGEIIASETLEIPARALIRQTLEAVRIDMHTETSRSISLETTPVVEYGNNRLYYLYRSVPRNPEWNEYHGTTAFDVRKVVVAGKEVLELSGVYFTSRKTVGRVRLRQVDRATETDVSFY